MPAATTLLAATRGLCSLSMTLKFTLWHVTVLKLERGRLEPKLADPLSVCSDVFPRISIQLLHPNGRCNTHWQCSGGTTRVNRQVDSLAHFSVDCIATKSSALAGFPLTNLLFLGLPIPLAVLFMSSDGTDGATHCCLISIGPLLKGQSSFTALAALISTFPACNCRRLQQPSFDSHSSYDRVRQTRSNDQ